MTLDLIPYIGVFFKINWQIPRNAQSSLRLAELVGNQTDQWGGA